MPKELQMTDTSGLKAGGVCGNVTWPVSSKYEVIGPLTEPKP